jgi:hypothetical protein
VDDRSNFGGPVHKARPHGRSEVLSSSQRTIGYVVAGAGAVGLAVGLVAGALAWS